jgi:hypothetical protein
VEEAGGVVTLVPVHPFLKNVGPNVSQCYGMGVRRRYGCVCVRQMRKTLRHTHNNRRVAGLKLSRGLPLEYNSEGTFLFDILRPLIILSPRFPLRLRVSRQLLTRGSFQREIESMLQSQGSTNLYQASAPKSGQLLASTVLRSTGDSS